VSDETEHIPKKKKKPRPWGAVSGRKRKPGRKRMKGNREQLLKNWAWNPVMIRIEHHSFLRELRAYYNNAPFGKIVGTLIVQEYCRILHTIDPVKATAIRKAYKSEKYKHEVIELAPTDLR
jgi:hypothetical protein